MKTPLVTELKHDSELFEQAKFDQLVAEKGSIALAFKQAIKDADTVLNQRFKRLENIKLIIRRRAWVMDKLLQQLWSHYACAQCPGIALLAVGGYGRAELHPHSDIDLMILIKDEAAAKPFHDDLSTFVTQLWDIGLEVGHSVRTLQQCAELAASDITIATNLMEARTIHGDPQLAREMQELTGPARIWDAKSFFTAKWTEQIARYDKFSNTEFNLEPDLKSAPGGLRDIQNIGNLGVGQAFFGEEDQRLPLVFGQKLHRLPHFQLDQQPMGDLLRFLTAIGQRLERCIGFCWLGIQ